MAWKEIFQPSTLPSFQSHSSLIAFYLSVPWEFLSHSFFTRLIGLDRHIQATPVHMQRIWQSTASGD